MYEIVIIEKNNFLSMISYLKICHITEKSCSNIAFIAIMFFNGRYLFAFVKTNFQDS